MSEINKEHEQLWSKLNEIRTMPIYSDLLRGIISLHCDKAQLLSKGSAFEWQPLAIEMLIDMIANFLNVCIEHESQDMMGFHIGKESLKRLRGMQKKNEFAIGDVVQVINEKNDLVGALVIVKQITNDEIMGDITVGYDVAPVSLKYDDIMYVGHAYKIPKY
jgi:hypothetical protein